MPKTMPVAVKDLALDLENFRTVHQTTELAAVDAMISTSPDRFWALVDSLRNDGYLPTESIIVLTGAGNPKALTVKEGNRRIAALKVLLGLLPIKTLSVPDGVEAQIKGVSKAWRHANGKVPCTIYKAGEAVMVDRIVTLAHGKGEKAGRDQWNAVARARHNRDINGGTEYSLDLLEAYLAHGRNRTPAQKSRWAGDYPLSVLEEATKKLAPRLGFATASALANGYPKTASRDVLEKILLDIGLRELGFDDIRAKEVDFGERYGIPISPSKGTQGSGGAKGGGSGANASGGNTSNPGSTGGASSTGPKTSPSAKPKALAISDPKMVKRQLKAFTPAGLNREKVVTLKTEAAHLDVGYTPLAFSFVLRSMFEISAKAYCSDHSAAGGPSMKKKDGSDHALADVLREVTKHLSKNSSDKEMLKALHGAMTELGNPNGLFSVTSFNQLVHNPKFSIAPSDVAIRFGNVFPLLIEMNR